MDKKPKYLDWQPGLLRKPPPEQTSLYQAKLRYRVDLKGFMAECETNYFRLGKLFPLFITGRELRIAFSPCDSRPLVLAVLETTPFTVLVGIRQETGGESPWLVAPPMRVRVYHDAKLAEVVACDHSMRVSPRNPYPNERMFQPDEKAQWNRFLGELLAACLSRGYSMANADGIRAGEISSATLLPGEP
ncbi:MAG: DUF1249 domain-containing protein [Porticoccaceae bacterium]